MWTKLTSWLKEKEQTPLDNYNESTRSWSKGYRKAFTETSNFISSIKPKDRQLLIIVLLIISITISLFIALHIRDSPKININTATVEALDSLPSIGNVLAVRVIQGRPYEDVYALDRVQGIGPKTIEAIKGRVVAK